MIISSSVFVGGVEKGQHYVFSTPFNSVLAHYARYDFKAPKDFAQTTDINIPEAVTRYQQIFAQKSHLRRPREWNDGVFVYIQLFQLLYSKNFIRNQRVVREVSHCWVRFHFFSCSVVIFFLYSWGRVTRYWCFEPLTIFCWNKFL